MIPNQSQSSLSSQKGFAMLFTVLIVSLILSIAVSISNITLKQAILSNLAKDSGIAFYQADAAVECGMYQDAGLGNFPLGTTVNTGASTDAIPTFDCGVDSSGATLVMELDASSSYTDYIKYIPQSAAVRTSNQPCFEVIFDKTHALETPGYSKVRGSGSNMCAFGPRKVERTLEVTY